MKKRAQISATATWIVATLIIVIVSVVFLFGVIYLSTLNKITETPNQIVLKTNNLNSEIIIQSSMNSFLYKKVELNGETTILEIIESESPTDESISIFKENGIIVINEILGHPDNNLARPKPYWLRVYNEGEELKKLDIQRKFHVGGHNCDPNNKDDSLLFTSFLKNKRVVLCLEKSYYEEWRQNKHA